MHILKEAKTLKGSVYLSKNCEILGTFSTEDSFTLGTEGFLFAPPPPAPTSFQREAGQLSISCINVQIHNVRVPEA